MTNITIQRSAVDRGRGDGSVVYALTAEGHANGSTACCAAISMMWETLIAWVRNHHASSLTSGLAPGCAELVFTVPEIQCGAADTAVDFVAIGLRQLAMSFPDAVRVRCIGQERGTA